jgi:rhodanese-related sulfurtransferase
LLADAGYTTYNVANGFEGQIDAAGHRGTLNGWKAEDLPWRQS